GKATNLGVMLRAGVPVPDGFCLTTAAYHAFLRDRGSNLPAVIRAALSDINPYDHETLRSAADTIEAAFLGAPVPEHIRAAIHSAYVELGEVPVAVRSSGTLEDLAAATFAGQHETWL